MTSAPKRDLMALSRAREKAALDWYAQNPDVRDFDLNLCAFSGWQEMKDAIKRAYAILQGFDSWDDFCKSDDPERWTK